MELIFWQGIISIHQKTFLEALVKQPSVSKVLMVVETDITPYRKNMGWEVPQIEGVSIIVAPSRQQVAEIFDTHKEAVHILGGIRVGQLMTMAFEEGAKRNAKMGSLSEPYDRSGVKGMLRDLKYRYYKLRYFKHVDFFLAVGRAGVRTYTGLGFNPDRVFPWAYFVSVPVGVPQNSGNTPLPPDSSGQALSRGDVRRIIYAGRLDENKGIARFVAELVKVKDVDYTFDIYGGGADEEALKKIVAEHNLADRITFYPFLKYDELIQQYAKYDWVVLPSVRKDGWGVIISEGLLNGLKGICSNICGVSWAIKEHFNGVVFDWSQPGNCSKAITTMLKDDNFADSATIRKWADNAVSAEAGAKYYLRILDSVYNNKSKPSVPWEIFP